MHKTDAGDSFPGTRLYLLSILTLPWVGLGVIHFFTGHDVGSGLQLAWVFMALALACVAAKSLASRSGTGVFLESLQLPTSLVFITGGTFAVVLISGLGIIVAPSFEPLSSSWSRWGRQIIQLGIMFAFLLWPALWTRGRARWLSTLDFLFLGAFFQICYGLFQEIHFFHPLPWFGSLEGFFTSNPSILSGSARLYLNNMMQDIPRLRGTVCEPLYLGNYLLMVWPFLLMWRRPVFLRVFMGVLLGGLLLLTWSRGAWLGFVWQLVILGILLGRGALKLNITGGPSGARGRLVFWLFGGGLLLVAFGANFLADGFLLDRLQASFNNQDWSNLTRLYSMKAAWLAFLESPVVGIGWGQFAFHFPILVDPMGLQSQFTWPVVNNFPLLILSETGLLGFALFSSVGVFLLCRVRHALSADDSGKVLSTTVAMAGLWIQLLTFSQYNLPHIWIGTGLLLAAIYETQQDSTQTSPEKEDPC